jgi:hypothetical protein
VRYKEVGVEEYDRLMLDYRRGRYEFMRLTIRPQPPETETLNRIFLTQIYNLPSYFCMGWIQNALDLASAGYRKRGDIFVY